ncbi:MAG: condensin subunit MukF [Myxococcales bacterium]|nr:condensin subunit MukF [Myxococcales bacterium]
MRDHDHHRTIARLAQRGAALRVDTAELCCLAAMHLQGAVGESTLFEEERLAALFEATIEAVEPAAENPRKRATHAIERLRAQRLIVRLDGEGIVRAGEYALSPLAVNIVERQLADEHLTRASLDGLMTSVVSGLTAVRVAAEGAASEDDWDGRVRVPLEVVVAELLNGVERRQLGLDEQQRQVRAEITRLLEADWLDALGGIEALLDATADTLVELRRLLLQHTNLAHAVLDDVRILAQEHGRLEVLVALRRTGDQLDRLLAWGHSRHAAWSAYHGSVHRFLRDVVRLDPDRQLSGRLREQIGAWPETPFTLRLAQSPRLTVLRPPARPVERPAVVRPAQDWSAPVAAPPEAPSVDVAALVEAALAGGAARLSEVAAVVLAQVPEDARYGLIGRVAAVLAGRARDGHGGAGPWVAVGEGPYEVTEWTLEAGE